MRTLVALVCTLAVASGAHAAPSFKTPGGAAYCGVVEAFEVPRDYIPQLVCWTPNDGFTISMSPVGLVREKNYYQPNKGTNLPARVLPFGRNWFARVAFFGLPGRDVVYRCASRGSGLTCANASGHGWWLGRLKGYRTF